MLYAREACRVDTLQRRFVFTWLIYVMSAWVRSCTADAEIEGVTYLVSQHNELCHASGRSSLPYRVTYAKEVSVSASGNRDECVRVATSMRPAS